MILSHLRNLHTKKLELNLCPPLCNVVAKVGNVFCPQN